MPPDYKQPGAEFARGGSRKKVSDPAHSQFQSRFDPEPENRYKSAGNTSGNILTRLFGRVKSKDLAIFS